MTKSLVNFFCLLVAFLYLQGCEKEELSQLGTYTESVLHSDLINEDFKIFTFLPSDYSDQQTYPLVFLMDAEWYFEKTVREVEEMMTNNQISDCILVGVGYEGFDESQRFRDYTYPADDEYDISTGEADHYHDFLENELMPYIEDQFSVDPSQRILMGHSLGGLSAVYGLLRKPGSPFTGIVAISPSLWWVEQSIFGMEKDYLDAGNDLSAKLYIAVGGDEPPSMTILAEEMADRLQQRNYSNLDLKFHSYDGASHGQTPIRGFSDGLLFILN